MLFSLLTKYRNPEDILVCQLENTNISFLQIILHSKIFPPISETPLVILFLIHLNLPFSSGILELDILRDFFFEECSRKLIWHILCKRTSLQPSTLSRKCFLIKVMNLSERLTAFRMNKRNMTQVLPLSPHQPSRRSAPTK